MPESVVLGLLCNYLYVLVITAALANAVREVVLAALGALYKICRSFKLPYAGTSLVSSCFGNLFLRYCHC